MRLIDADALTEVLNVKKNCEDCDYQHGMFCSKSSDFVNACEAIYGAPTIEPEPHWIPCSERLPEHNQICIVTDETRRCAYEYGIHDETYDDENGWTYLGHRIIAWMPLPDPYCGADMRGENYEK